MVCYSRQASRMDSIYAPGGRCPLRDVPLHRSERAIFPLVRLPTKLELFTYVPYILTYILGFVSG